jgi:hypothetical protein
MPPRRASLACFSQKFSDYCPGPPDGEVVFVLAPAAVLGVEGVDVLGLAVVELVAVELLLPLVVLY